MSAPVGASEATGSGEGVRTLTAADIAASVGGELRGPGDVTVRAVAPIHRARPQDLTFLGAARYAPLLASSEPGVLLVTPELAETPGRALARVVVDNPQDAMLALLPRLYRAPRRAPGVHVTASIGRGARVGRDASIAPYAVIGDGARVGDSVTIGAHAVIGEDVVVGDECQLFPHVTLYSGTILGARVVIHAGARIGSDGFGYVFHEGAHAKIPHVGRCIVEDDVEIGANTTVDRGSIDDTVIGAGTKIDNLVQIAHNVRVGRLCLLMAQVGVAGSVRIGDGCILAGQVGVSGHHEIGDGARLAAQAGVFGDIPAGETWSGYPARPHRESLRAHAALFRLAGLMKRLERLLGDKG
ncbi:MAG TPA: UDP-3-O-(3-hydroxymyristoyl)glucosamine N-acyltransferase [Gemmatimonadaceae bacterium]|nr:UDP-3-O-(3-hydroxymyristoyl)glucosamine N-acyltransferase [Gemmatimonadaceae bacterium]